MNCLRHARFLFAIVALTIAAMLVSGCSSAVDSATLNAGAPLPQVSVATATTETVTDEREFTGRTATVAAPLEQEVIGLQAVFDLLSILTHHDHWSLNRCQAREDQV